MRFFNSRLIKVRLKRKDLKSALERQFAEISELKQLGIAEEVIEPRETETNKLHEALAD